MTPEAVRSLSKALAVVVVVVGGLGSIACLPFAFCTNLGMISAAGIYFIAGAVMITGGLVSFALLTRDAR